MGADSIYFLRVRNWGTVATEEFLDLDVCAPTLPRPARQPVSA